MQREEVSLSSPTGGAGPVRNCPSAVLRQQRALSSLNLDTRRWWLYTSLDSEFRRKFLCLLSSGVVQAVCWAATHSGGRALCLCDSDKYYDIFSAGLQLPLRQTNRKSRAVRIACYFTTIFPITGLWDPLYKDPSPSGKNKDVEGEVQFTV